MMHTSHRTFRFLPLVVLALAPAGSGFSRALLDYGGVPLLQPAVPVVDMVDAAETLEAPLRVGFYNIENFTDGIGDGDTRTPDRARGQAALAADILREIDADILVLAEIENPAALALLNQALPEPYPGGWVTRLEPENRREKLNLGLLTRVRPLAVDELDFGALLGPGRPPRGALRVQVRLDYRSTLVLYVVHLKSNYGDDHRNFSKRYNAMRIVRANADQLMASDPETLWHVLVLGDMNTDPALPRFGGDPSLDPFDDWSDLWLEVSGGSQVTLPFRASSPFRYDPSAFDRILASPEWDRPPWVAGEIRTLPRGVNTKAPEIIPGEDGHVSDHYPVFLDLLLE